MKPLQEIIYQKDHDVQETLQFILGHFEEAHFPRTISTKTTDNRQIIVYSKEEAIARFKQANYLDCRINAFPYVDGFYNIPVNLIFIDLDLSNFNSKLGLERGLSVTLQKIIEKLDSEPTVLWTGNGYHIYQPIDGLILEEIEEFKKFNEVSKVFLKFASQYLSNCKCDPNNSPSLKSCLLRIPGSINSKCLANEKIEAEVKVIQRWNGIRPSINLLLGNFYAYLIDLRPTELDRQRKLEKQYGKVTSSNSKLKWVETLLQTSIDDYRKTAVSLILSPYLINIRKVGYQEAYTAINDWLNKCNSVRRLDFDDDYKIKTSLKIAIKERTLPMKFSTLKTKNTELHDIVSVKMQQSEATRGGIRNF